MRTNRPRTLAVLSGFVILCLLAGGCAPLVDELQRMLGRAVEEEIDALQVTAQAEAGNLRETVEAQASGLQETAQAGLDDVRATAEAAPQVLGATAEAGTEGIPEAAGNAFQNAVRSAQEWLGLAAPADVGAVTIAISTQSSRSVIKTAFEGAFRRAGGGKSIGSPLDVVQREGDAILIQHFTGGSEKRAAIVMKDGESNAYVVSGQWYDTYQVLGGPTGAGYPFEDRRRWGVWPVEVWRDGRGTRQLFSGTGGVYALMKASGMENVHIVPPFVWNEYEKGGWVYKIGYPLSSYPVNDRIWEENTSLPSETELLLDVWKNQNFRSQVFENGGVLFDPSHAEVFFINEQNIFGFGLLSEGRFMVEVGDILAKEYLDKECYFQPTDCYCETLRHSVLMSKWDGAGRAWRWFTVEMMKAPFVGMGLIAESSFAKFSLFIAQTTLERIRSDTWGEAFVSELVGLSVESIYSLGIGEVLSIPATQVTTTFTEEEIQQFMSERFSALIDEEAERIMKARFTAHLTVPEGAKGITLTSLIPGNATMDASLVVSYDPLLNMVNGVMTTQQCPSSNTVFFFKFHAGKVGESGRVANSSEGWDGKVYFVPLGPDR